MTKHRQGATSVISVRLRQWAESEALQNKKTGSLLLPSRNIIIGRQGGTHRNGSELYRVNRGRKRARKRNKNKQSRNTTRKSQRGWSPQRSHAPGHWSHSLQGHIEAHAVLTVACRCQKGTADRDRGDGRKQRQTGTMLVIFQLCLR